MKFDIYGKITLFTVKHPQKIFDTWHDYIPESKHWIAWSMIKPVGATKWRKGKLILQEEAWCVGIWWENILYQEERC